MNLRYRNKRNEPENAGATRIDLELEADVKGVWLPLGTVPRWVGDELRDLIEDGKRWRNLKRALAGTLSE